VTSVARSRWLAIALLASLGVNLFFAGQFSARRAFGPPPPPPDPAIMLPRLIDDLASVLAAPDTNVLRQVFRLHETEIRQRSADIRRAHDGVRDALDHEPFEPAALLAALDEVKAKDAALREVMQQALLETVTQISPEARHKLASWGPMRH
jgi:uncharacterized membrane protein